MSADDRQKQFGGDVLALAVAFGMRDRLDDKRIGLYWESLKDIPPHILSAGAQHCMKACERFPSIAEWRRACDDVNRSMLFPEDLPPAPAQLPGEVSDSQPEWHDHSRAWHHCTECRDTGFAPRICRPGARCGCTYHLCAARPEDYTHRYVTKCFCRDTNPVLAHLRAEAKKKQEHAYGKVVSRER